MHLGKSIRNRKSNLCGHNSWKNTILMVKTPSHFRAVFIFFFTPSVGKDRGLRRGGGILEPFRMLFTKKNKLETLCNFPTPLTWVAVDLSRLGYFHSRLGSSFSPSRLRWACSSASKFWVPVVLFCTEGEVNCLEDLFGGWLTHWVTTPTLDQGSDSRQHSTWVGYIRQGIWWKDFAKDIMQVELLWRSLAGENCVFFQNVGIQNVCF